MIRPALEMPRVFISHATADTRDRETALVLKAGLEHAGAKCWIAPESIAAGDEWERQIVVAVSRECTHFVVVLSAAALQSKWVAREIELAQQRRELDPSFLICPIVIGRLGTHPLASLQAIIYHADPDVLIESVCATIGLRYHPLEDSLRAYLDAHGGARGDDHELRRMRLDVEVKLGARRVPLSDVLAQHRHVLVHGAPGSGKSVFLRKLLRRRAAALRDALGGAEDPKGDLQSLPVHLELGLLQGTHHRLADYVVERLGLSGEPLGALDRVLARFELMLLLDGLNELPRSDRRPVLLEIIHFVQSLAVRRNGSRVAVVVTSRSYGLHDELQQLEHEGFVAVEILPLDPDQMVSELAANLSMSRAEARDLLHTLDQKLRLFLATAQHLDYVIRWCRDAQSRGDGLGLGLRTRGQLLDYIVQDRLQTIGEAERETVAASLGALAYATGNSAVFFDVADVTAAAVHGAGQVPLVRPSDVVSVIFESGLVTRVEGRCRFDHHSFQQYFLAREMTRRMDELDEYIRGELWHEPLVIMAGLLERQQLHVLLARLAGNPLLYAYVVANVDEPELAKRFLEDRVSGFTFEVRHVALRMARLLAALAIAWVLALPVLIVALVQARRPWARLLVICSAFAYLAGGLPLLLRWHAHRFGRRLAALRNDALPGLVAINRVLPAQGALALIRDELASILSTLTDDRGYDEADPRVRFVSEALDVVESAADTVSFLSEDEMLEQVGDPLVAAIIDPTAISTGGVDALCARARFGADLAARQNALDVLAKVYSARPELRSLVICLLETLLLDADQPQGVRLHAARTCRRLRIPIPTATGRGLFNRFRALLAWLRSLLRTGVAPRGRDAGGDR